VNRSVLIVTPFFAPQSHAAVFRAYKLAKYLPRLGWKPYVVTTDVNYLYNEDPSLAEALPEEVEVVRARYVEPSLRGLRMALGGRDRTFKAMKEAGEFAAAKEAGSVVDPGMLQRIYRYCSERWLRNPDAYWTWRRPALRAAKRLIARHDIPIVLTSSDPYTCHIIGRGLQRRGCKWVADLRDPHVYNHATSSRRAAVFARQRAAERAAALGADAVTTAASAIGMILTDMYGVRDTRRIRFIPTGLDEELLPPEGAAPPREGRYVVFSGEYLPEYGGEFLEIFAAATAEGAAGEGVKLLFAGRREVNEPRVRPHVEQLGIGDKVEFVDHVPQEELYSLLRGAEAALLVSSRLYRWWCLHAKLVDYIALRIPVLAVVPDPSEARTHLTRAGLGVFLDGDREACARRLSDFLEGRMQMPPPDEAECERFTARRQAEAFAGLFEEVLAAGKP